jgi:formylglycine-generating enzyme required for sulfatase activity
MKTGICCLLFIASLLSTWPTSAQVPVIINYQSRVTVNSGMYNGLGYFKFALVSDGNTIYWSHDGTSNGEYGEPSGSIQLSVSKNQFTVLLGDTSITGMSQAILPSVFDNDEVYLRAWINDGSTGFQMLAPDQQIAAAIYALVAARVRDGAVSAAVRNPALGVRNRTGSSWVSLTGRGRGTVTPIANMVWIQPGTFVMGSSDSEVDRSSVEGPQTAVTISRGFWMGKYEVTQGEYLAVMGSNPSEFSTSNGYAQDLSRAVETVSWDDATTYCGQLTQRERTAGRIATNSVYRLPTEAEWEYACRAKTSTRFSFGDDPGYTNLTHYAWYSGNSGQMTHPVGQKLPNPWGFYDMHGNVYEWCQDWFGEYPGGSVTDPQGPATGAHPLIRGGGWIDGTRFCRSAERGYGSLDTKHSFIGFRVVLAPGQP